MREASLIVRAQNPAVNLTKVTPKLSCFTNWKGVNTFHTNFYPLPKAYTLNLKKHIFTKFSVVSKTKYLTFTLSFSGQLGLFFFFLHSR